jgi:hypothetical protein
MQSQGNNFSRGRRVRRKPKNRTRNSRGLQSQGLAYNYAVKAGPIRAPPLPKEFSVHLDEFYSRTSNATADLEKITLGMLEYLNRLPMFATEFYTLYKYCRITAVEIQLELSNIGASSIQFVVGHCPYEDVSSMTVSKLSQLPGSTRRTVSAKGGMDRATINKFFNVQQLIGNPAYDKTYWVDATQAVSATPIDVKEPVIVLLIDNSTTGTTDFQYDVVGRIRYHIQWFDIETAGES